MVNSYKSGLIVALATFSALGLSGCGDEPEPNQAPPAPPPATQPSPAAPAESSAPAAPATPAAPAAEPAAAAQPAAPAEPPPYHATLAEGIDFKKPGYPDFLAEVTGVSGREAWGRWTDGPTATFKFKEALPKKFTLLVEAGSIGGDNMKKPFKFRVGSVEKQCMFTGDPFAGSRVATLHFESTEPGNTITVTIPAPLNTAEDPRKMGLGLITMKIDTSGKL